MMTETVPARLIDLAARMADAAGAAIRPHYRSGVVVDDKADLSPVTAADREAERAIRALIAEHCPGHGIVGEEFGTSDPDAEWVWVIDPIDGTKSFIAGRPIFATLIALLHRGRPVLGVIDQPIVRDRWIGADGHFTTLNGAPARVRACPKGLAGALLSTTSPDLFPAADLPAFRRCAATAKVTLYGGDAYSYGLVASGFCDVVVEGGLKLYDFAALAPVVIGAGGVMTDWRGEPLGQRSDGRVVAAGDPAVHADAIRALEG